MRRRHIGFCCTINKPEIKVRMEIFFTYSIFKQNLNAMDDPTDEFGSMILKACASGNLAELIEIKRAVGDDIEFRQICDGYTGFTYWNVLHDATKAGNFEICEFLIESVGVLDTPLMLAVKEEHVKIAKYLINQGALVNLSNSSGFTPLHYAAIKDNRELMELLVLNGASIEADYVNGTPLHSALYHGNVKATKFLLSQGAERNSISSVFGSPLLCAINSNSLECMELLLEAGADPNMFVYGFSPLSYAAKEGNPQLLKLLIGAKADPDLPSTDSMKPIEVAALAHNLECVRYLFKLTERIPHYPNWTVDGIMEHCKTMAQETAVLYKQETEGCFSHISDSSKIGELIVEAGVSGYLAKLKGIKQRVGDDREFRRICDEYHDFRHWRVLHCAAEMGHLEICKFLVQNVKVHLDVLTIFDDTPMMLAVKKEHLKIVKYLIDQGARVEMSNSYKYTALHYAVLKDNWELMELLVLGGAPIEADSHNGKPLLCAASGGSVKAVKYLLNHGAEPNLISSVSGSRLKLAAKSYSRECKELLLAAQNYPNKFVDGLSPLSHAEESDTQFLEPLLAGGAAPNLPSTGKDFFQDIPSEMVLEILSGVPVQTVMICKVVCKSWLDLIRSPRFVNEHLSKSAQCLAVYEQKLNSSSYKIMEFVEEFGVNTVFHFDVPYDEPVHSSANGLLFCVSYNRGDLILCNPIIREYMRLPSPRPSSFLRKEWDGFGVIRESFGFGVSRVSLEYKVVRVFYERLVPPGSDFIDVQHECQVYTVGTGSWRQIAGCPSTFVNNAEGVFLNGNIHWLANEKFSSEWISCFDLERERFTTFSLPTASDPCQDKSLSVLGPSLCVCIKLHYDIIIWVLKKYGDDKSWTKDFALHTETEFPYPYYELLRPIKVFGDGDIMMERVMHEMNSRSWVNNERAYYSSKTESMETVDLTGSCYNLYSRTTTYTPSFVSLKTFATENVRSF